MIALLVFLGCGGPTQLEQPAPPPVWPMSTPKAAPAPAAVPGLELDAPPAAGADDPATAAAAGVDAPVAEPGVDAPAPAEPAAAPAEVEAKGKAPPTP